MSMKNKGQTTMEYLMTYGWAILIVIVVVGALYAMGVFGRVPTPEDTTICKQVCLQANLTYYRNWMGDCECIPIQNCIVANNTKYCQKTETYVYVYQKVTE